MLNRALFSLLLLSSAAAAQTQYGTAPKDRLLQSRAVAGCPWLTEGSAARALGGEVSVTVKVSECGEGSADFRGSRVRTIPSRFSSAKLRCPRVHRRAQHSKGIGNEAAEMQASGSRTATAVEMISSRVRDLHFTVTLTTRAQKNLSKTRRPHQDRCALEQIAEQVAGNLY